MKPSHLFLLCNLYRPWGGITAQYSYIETGGVKGSYFDFDFYIILLFLKMFFHLWSPGISPCPNLFGFKVTLLNLTYIWFCCLSRGNVPMLSFTFSLRLKYSQRLTDEQVTLDILSRGSCPEKGAAWHVLIMTDFLCCTHRSVPSCKKLQPLTKRCRVTVSHGLRSRRGTRQLPDSRRRRGLTDSWWWRGRGCPGTASLEPNAEKQTITFLCRKESRGKSSHLSGGNQKMSLKLSIIRGVYLSTSPKRTPSTARTWPGRSRFWATAWGWRDCRTSEMEYGRQCTDLPNVPARHRGHLDCWSGKKTLNLSDSDEVLSCLVNFLLYFSTIFVL